MSKRNQPTASEIPTTEKECSNVPPVEKELPEPAPTEECNLSFGPLKIILKNPRGRTFFFAILFLIAVIAILILMRDYYNSSILKFFTNRPSTVSVPEWAWIYLTRKAVR